MLLSNLLRYRRSADPAIDAPVSVDALGALANTGDRQWARAASSRPTRSTRFLATATMTALNAPRFVYRGKEPALGRELTQHGSVPQHGRGLA